MHKSKFIRVGVSLNCNMYYHYLQHYLIFEDARPKNCVILLLLLLYIIISENYYGLSCVTGA